MDKGVYGGRRLISENWITQATTAQVKVPPAYGTNFDYGFQIWCGRDTDSFLFNGMFGQNVIGWFKSRVLLVTNAGSEESFQQGPFYGIAEKILFRPVKAEFSGKEHFSSGKGLARCSQVDIRQERARSHTAIEDPKIMS